jgi:hypothetical protein
MVIREVVVDLFLWVVVIITGQQLAEIPVVGLV